MAIVEHGEGLRIAPLHEGDQILVGKERVLSVVSASVRHTCVLRERCHAGSSLALKRTEPYVPALQPADMAGRRIGRHALVVKHEDQSLAPQSDGRGIPEGLPSLR